MAIMLDGPLRTKSTRYGTGDHGVGHPLPIRTEIIALPGGKDIMRSLTCHPAWTPWILQD